MVMDINTRQEIKFRALFKNTVILFLAGHKTIGRMCNMIGKLGWIVTCGLSSVFAGSSDASVADTVLPPGDTIPHTTGLIVTDNYGKAWNIDSLLSKNKVIVLSQTWSG